MKVMNDHRSKFSNLSSWKEKPEKNQGFKFTAMIIHYFHLQPQYKYESFHIYFTLLDSVTYFAKFWCS